MLFDFTAAYNRQSWINFFKTSFLHEDFTAGDEPVSFDFKPNYLSDPVRFLGTSSALDLNVYEMHHKSYYDPRIGISRDAFRFLEHYKTKNALILFISDNSPNYRLSLITRELRMDGKKVTTTFTNPRRFSYLLGPGIKTHTVEEYLIKRERIKDETDLKSRFSVEIVNKHFYNSIADQFSQLVGGSRKESSSVKEYRSLLQLPGNPDQTVMRQFAVRLIGRIVFCWFLKKKTSTAGIPLIPEEVLSTGAVEEHPNYYRKILEPLFFEVMNKKREERREKIQDHPLFKDIPFLNGGLFDYNIHSDYYEPQPDYDLQEFAFGVIIPDKWFLDLFATLELYNFTIDENTPVDIDISVDPEMLGRIFENLLAEINPETSETARKNTGSYYTPRPIVEYMVDESLTEYLLSRFQDRDTIEPKIRALFDYRQEDHNLTDEDCKKISEALDRLKVLDPACGSGAFPMGILQKMLLIRQKMINNSGKDSSYDENRDYRYKLYAIRRSIYGVDKQSIAVEIAKLRLFLTLIVDEAIEDNKPNRAVKPLPNLSFKFVAADSLIDLDLNKSDQFDWMINELFDEFIDKLERLRDQFFYAETDLEKDHIKREFLNVQRKLEEYITHHKIDQTLKFSAEKLANWHPFSDLETEWFSPKWMFGVHEGFDVVIGNPPYIQLQKDGGCLADRYQKEGFVTFCRTGDIYSLFYERGINLLKSGGVLCYITSKQWMRTQYGEATRKFFSQYQPLILIDLGSNIFESATVDTNILLINKTKEEKHSLKALDISQEKKKENFISHPDWVTLTNLSSDTWTISSPIAQRIKEKIERKGKPLKDWDVGIYYGIKTGFNEAFIIDSAKREELLNKCKTSSERQRTEQLLKPILRGRDIKRYKADWAGLWLIATHNGYSNEQGNHIPPVDINEYPSLKQHLDQYYPQLEKRYDKGNTPYNLRNCAYQTAFDKEKLMYPDIGDSLSLIYDPRKYYCTNTVYFLSTGNKYLLAALNSKAVNFFYKQKASGLGSHSSRSFTFIHLQIPIPYIKKDDQKPFIDLTNKIISLKETNQSTDKLESQINRLVYQLYNLTPEEINFIEHETISVGKKDL